MGPHSGLALRGLAHRGRDAVRETKEPCPGLKGFCISERPYRNRTDVFHPSVAKTETSIMSGDKLSKSDSRRVLVQLLPSGDGGDGDGDLIR